MAYIRPVRLVKPFITLTSTGTTPVTVDLTCFARGVHLMGEEDDALATFCDPLGLAWILTIDLLQSLGAEGLEEALSSLGAPGDVLGFEFAYTDDVASIDNPHWSGEVLLVAWPVVDAGINEPTEINLEMDVIGEVTKEPASVPPVTARRARKEPATV